jgi:Flp pilus assembly protein TadD
VGHDALDPDGRRRDEDVAALTHTNDGRSDDRHNQPDNQPDDRQDDHPDDWHDNQPNDQPDDRHDDRRAVTGRRSLAFTAYADEHRLPGLLTLLRSLALSNPAVCEDFIVLHPGPGGCADAWLEPARALHPRIIARPAERRTDVFRIQDYDTVIALDPGMVVLDDIGELLRLRTGIAAVPQLVAEELPKERRTVADDGLLVIQRDALDAAALARLDGDSAEGRVDRALEGRLVPLDARYDFPAHRLYDDLPVPEGVAVLRFTQAAEGPGFAPAHDARRRFQTDSGDDGDSFRAAYCALPAATAHPDLLVHLATPLLRARPHQVDLARAVAEVHRRQSRYQEAVDVLSAAVGGEPDRPRCHETLGICLMALSRYDEAETHLLLAAASPGSAAKAFGQLARLAWIRGRDEAAHAYAREGLDTNPTDADCRAWYARTRPREERTDRFRAAEQLAHVALYAELGENAGDRVLPEAVRLCFDANSNTAHAHANAHANANANAHADANAHANAHTDADAGPRSRWLPLPVHRLFGERALAEVNARRGIVVGGGGLFLPDTSPNGDSGWQWNIPDDMLARITVPLAVFAVGYNVFDGQRYARRRFAESLRVLVERSAFFGLRNRGSVERVRELLPAELGERVRYQPCPTTVTRKLLPDWSDPERRDDTVLINCAYDRAGLRFGHDYGHFLAEMAAAVRALGGLADVRYAAHMTADETFVHDLRREHGIALPVVPLYDATNDEILDVYRRTRLVIGMRGHAGMIPFGCGTPIISLVSHPKLAYFLADLDRPQWGVSVHERMLGARLTERATALLADHPAAVADVHDRQEVLWKVTEANMAELRGIFGAVGPPFRT